MKKILLLSLFCMATLFLSAQDDEYQRYIESLQKEKVEFDKETNNTFIQMRKEYYDFRDSLNAEFAEFVAKEWKLFEDFKAQELSMTVPKLKEIPKEKEKEITDIESSEVKFKTLGELPEVTNTVSVNDGYNVENRMSSYVVKKSLNDTGITELPRPDKSEEVKNGVLKGSDMSINFYGKKIDFKFDNKLLLKSKGNKEVDVADYFKEIAKMSAETSSLWQQIDKYVNDFGLNDWGHFCLVRSISETAFDDIDNRVLFCFYMLRNEGGYKVRLARGKESDKLTLLAALDNKKEVYSYIFFRFDDKDGSKLKYYALYGGGNAQESVYSYDYCSQDSELKQIGLDFYHALNMGACDITRELNISKINSTITLPYNSSHIKYLNDVPMTIFPIYFVSPVSIEAQKILNERFNELKKQYTPVQFIDILLNFVQTAFEYETDENQFGYEKYFYPEEVIAYPCSDCEDRSALFSWLVTNYTDAKVIGLQYEGHIATAVCFGDKVNINGDVFSYAGKKYYVCDPTYINASIGMTMPQFKDKMPKIIRIKR